MCKICRFFFCPNLIYVEIKNSVELEPTLSLATTSWRHSCILNYYNCPILLTRVCVTNYTDKMPRLEYFKNVQTFLTLYVKNQG